MVYSSFISLLFRLTIYLSQNIFIMPKYKLAYFPVRGKGEMIRFIFHQAAVPFEDHQITLDDWPKHKNDMPYNKLPVLYVDGKALPQSLTIARYLAGLHGLSPEDPLDRAFCESYVEHIYNDMYETMWPAVKPLAFGNDEEASKREWNKFKTNDLVEFLDRFEKVLETTATGLLVGSKLSWADLALAEMTDRFVTCFDKEALVKHSRIAAHTTMVHDLPNIKKYVAGRQLMRF